MRKEIVLTLALAALLLLSACTGSEELAPVVDEPAPLTVAEETSDGEADTSEAMDSDAEAGASDAMAEDMATEAGSESDQPNDAANKQTDMADDMVAGSEEMAAETVDEVAMNPDAPAWQQLALTNARTGESFTLADFAGKTVFVEPMATWCTNCRRQLTHVKQAKTELAADDVVFVGLSVETAIDNGSLANYADEAGFDWHWAVLTPEMLQALAGEFGQTIANPPATPHFIIRPDGSTTDLVTGVETAEQIVAQIEAARG
ncbi:MAG: redoxin family protein [Chloroflexota bacterium]|nr:MAG: redoxin family protein [Chloroflexota bacterium]